MAPIEPSGLAIWQTEEPLGTGTVHFGLPVLRSYEVSPATVARITESLVSHAPLNRLEPLRSDPGAWGRVQSTLVSAFWSLARPRVVLVWPIFLAVLELRTATTPITATAMTTTTAITPPTIHQTALDFLAGGVG